MGAGSICHFCVILQGGYRISSGTESAAVHGQPCFHDARGDHCVAITHELVEIAEFKHFYEHFTFGKTAWSDRGKQFEKYITVVIALDLVTVAM